MKEIKIEHLAYLLKQAKTKKQPQPIFFLGAGASRSGNIPLASEIIKQILKDYSDSPFIKELPEAERTYAKLMNCLLPDQRDELLKKYIDEAKINVTHIYLAQLINEGFVDYVLTVNFDNLMLRALALFNIFPSTYDMAILKEFTTSTFKEKSVVYLHGQNHGLWLLNTPEEMEKVKNTVPRIFDTIKNKRPWVFIGYSGEDPIFEHVKNLGRFNNGFYWVTYNDSVPNKNVQKLITDPNTNASLIKGYDSDSFMLKLNSELGLSQPNIVDKPFSALKNMLSEIVDINEKEHFKGVKERLEIAKKQVDEAIQQYELGNMESLVDVDKNKIDLLKKEIINILISQEFNEEVILGIDERVKGIADEKLQVLHSELYSDWGSYLGTLAKKSIEKRELYNKAFEKYKKSLEIKPNTFQTLLNWGTELGELAEMKKDGEAEELYLKAFEKYKKALEIEPESYEVFTNWGNNLGALAEMKVGKEAEELYLQAFEKHQKATEIKPHAYEAFVNWGIDLANFAETKTGEEAEKLFYEAFTMYQKAIDINSELYESYNNWGTALGSLAAVKENQEAEELYNLAFEKYKKAVDLEPNNQEIIINWANNLGELAKRKDGKEADEIYSLAFDKYQKAIELQPDDYDAFNYWGVTLRDLANTKEGKKAEELYQLAFEKFQKAIEYGSSSYNLSCFYALKGDKENALKYLELCLSKNEMKVDFVEKDEDWKNLLDDKDFITILNKYR